MLRQRALLIALVVLAFAGAWILWSRRAAEREAEVEVEREVEVEVEAEAEPEVEREVEVEHEVEVEREVTPTPAPPPIQVGGTEVRLAQIRQEVHVLEIQRLEARDRGDTATEQRLDAEIARLRAEHEALRHPPQGI